jgi:hypothetical protein
MSQGESSFVNALLWKTGKTWKPFPTQCWGGARRISLISLHVDGIGAAVEEPEAARTRETDAREAREATEGGRRAAVSRGARAANMRRERKRPDAEEEVTCAETPEAPYDVA